MFFAGTATIVLCNFPGEQQLRILVGHRKDLDFWAFPGGSVEPTDEDVFSAAGREVKEETGLDVQYLKNMIPEFHLGPGKKGLPFLTVFLVAEALNSVHKFKSKSDDTWIAALPVAHDKEIMSYSIPSLDKNHDKWTYMTLEEVLELPSPWLPFDYLKWLFDFLLYDYHVKP